MKPTSVIIMDTHPIIRMSIEVLLQKNSELQIVLKTDDYRITIDYLRTRPVDLIIMDIDLPGTDGFTFRWVREVSTFSPCQASSICWLKLSVPSAV
ncbi:response regulator, partial [Escherichia coli]|uniref:response regulator n=1 Tax=Escherichia coli TaxID=562 RepID=UPI0021E9601D